MKIRAVVARLTLLCSLGCQLPTAPDGGHAALAASGLSISSTGRQRAVDPSHRLSPPCSAPAPLRSTAPQDRAPGYIFAYRAGTDAVSVTAELALRYGFVPEFVYPSLGFAAVVTEQALAGIRCDPRIEHVEYDAIVRIAGR